MKHNKAEDLWVVINNGVYDLTKYGNEHPGGKFKEGGKNKK